MISDDDKLWVDLSRFEIHSNRLKWTQIDSNRLIGEIDSKSSKINRNHQDIVDLRLRNRFFKEGTFRSVLLNFFSEKKFTSCSCIQRRSYAVLSGSTGSDTPLDYDFTFYLDQKYCFTFELGRFEPTADWILTKRGSQGNQRHHQPKSLQNRSKSRISSKIIDFRFGLETFWEASERPCVHSKAT